MPIYHEWGYSSVVEHSTADREVLGSTPSAPSAISFSFSNKSCSLCFFFHYIKTPKNCNLDYIVLNLVARWMLLHSFFVTIFFFCRGRILANFRQKIILHRFHIIISLMWHASFIPGRLFFICIEQNMLFVYLFFWLEAV